MTVAEAIEKLKADNAIALLQKKLALSARTRRGGQWKNVPARDLVPGDIIVVPSGRRAGIAVVEARLSHLAYAPEIAHAMLQRQQASAVVAARRKIVDGAVGMVEMALTELTQKQIVDLPADEKSRLVSNLLVVLCSEHAAQPVLNTGASS
mgnify:CR=1 FL=1